MKTVATKDCLIKKVMQLYQFVRCKDAALPSTLSCDRGVLKRIKSPIPLEFRPARSGA